MKDKETQFIDRLRQANQRVSSPRLTLFKALLRNGPITAGKLVDIMAKNAIDPATTYRNLKLFRELEVIEDIVAGGKRLVELSDDYEGHHHHFWCRNCGKLIDFDDSTIEQELKALGQARGFTISSHHLEISGLCANCQTAKV